MNLTFLKKVRQEIDQEITDSELLLSGNINDELGKKQVAQAFNKIATMLIKPMKPDQIQKLLFSLRVENPEEIDTIGFHEKCKQEIMSLKDQINRFSSLNKSLEVRL